MGKNKYSVADIWEDLTPALRQKLAHGLGVGQGHLALMSLDRLLDGVLHNKDYTLEVYRLIYNLKRGLQKKRV